MYKIDGPDAVPVKPAKKPPASNPGWFQGGDPAAGLSATMVTCDIMNMLLDELTNVVTGAGMALDRNDDHQLLAAIKKLVVAVVNTSPDIRIAAYPVGGILPFWSESAPEGFLPCTGVTFSATLYPQLYAFLGQAITPDFRGKFMRGAGGNAGPVRSSQSDAGRNVTGDFLADDSQLLPNTGNTYVDDPLHGCFVAEIHPEYNYDLYSVPQFGGAGRIKLDASRSWGAEHTANEFRPQNYAVLWCMKHD